MVDESHGFLAQVAAFSDGPLVVLLQQDGTDEADNRGVVWEDPATTVERRRLATAAKDRLAYAEEVSAGDVRLATMPRRPARIVLMTNPTTDPAITPTPGQGGLGSVR